MLGQYSFKGMDDFEKINSNQFICRVCGAKVPSGIFNISSHWTMCSGRTFYEALKVLAEDKSGHIDISDVSKASSQHLNN